MTSPPRLTGAHVTLPALDSIPLVSVLMPCFNYAAFVHEAVESVLSQSYDNLELVACDDGSTDGSSDIIEFYAREDDRVRLIRKRNGGQASALNRAFSESIGAIVCILDADDTFRQFKIEAVVNTFVDNRHCGIVTHDLQVVDACGTAVARAVCGWEGDLGADIASLRSGLPFPMASGLSFRRAVLEAVMPLPEELFRDSADWAIAYPAAFVTLARRIPRDLACYRVHGDNLSGTTSTNRTLDAGSIRKVLSGLRRVVAHTDAFCRQRLGSPVPERLVRNALEHRLMLGILEGDRASLAGARVDLRTAFLEARRDYPRWRYHFWMGLAALPSPPSPACAPRGVSAVSREAAVPARPALFMKPGQPAVTSIASPPLVSLRFVSTSRLKDARRDALSRRRSGIQDSDLGR